MLTSYNRYRVDDVAFFFFYYFLILLVSSIDQKLYKFPTNLLTNSYTFPSVELLYVDRRYIQFSTFKGGSVIHHIDMLRVSNLVLSSAI